MPNSYPENQVFLNSGVQAVKNVTHSLHMTYKNAKFVPRKIAFLKCRGT